MFNTLVLTMAHTHRAGTQWDPSEARARPEALTAWLDGDELWC